MLLPIDEKKFLLNQAIGPVTRIGGAPHVAGALESVDHARHRSARQARLERQLTGGQPAAALENVEAMQIRHVHAQLPSGEFVERVVQVAARPELEEERVDPGLLG